MGSSRGVTVRKIIAEGRPFSQGALAPRARRAKKDGGIG
jgi:hypothetical protein